MKHVVTTVMVGLVLGAGSVLAKDKTPRAIIPVYVVQPAGEFEDAALKQRRDSTKDLMNALYGKEKTLRLVESRELAKIVIEVMDRGAQTTDNRVTTRSDPDTFLSRSLVDKVVAVRLSVGAYETVIEGRSEGKTEYSITTWRRAASAAARAIDDWIQRNHSKLVTP
jgi:hypothetical protein